MNKWGAGMLLLFGTTISSRYFKDKKSSFHLIKCYALIAAKWPLPFSISIWVHIMPNVCSLILLGHTRICSQYIRVRGSQLTSYRKPRSPTHSIYKKLKTSSTAKYQINPFNKRYQYSNDLINTYIIKVEKVKVTMVRWGSSIKKQKTKTREKKQTKTSVSSSILGVWAREMPPFCSFLHLPADTCGEPPS